MPAPSSENISDPLYPPTRKFLPTVLLCLVSAALLIFAFPKTDIWFFSWIGFIPLMFALDGKKSAAAFGTAYLCGFLFFIGTLYWFIFMRDSAGVPGFLAFGAAILIALYLAIYFALFGWFYIYFSSRSVLVKMVLYSSVWASSEFLRDWIFTGFGWLCLGYSQYKVLPLIQIADITGVFGVSFLIMMVNYILKETFSSRKASQELGIAAFILLMVLGYGVMKLNIQTPSQGTAIIAVIQPNIAQQIKWEPSIWPLTMKKLQELTESTVSSAKANGQNIDLIIWPETSFPGYIWESPELYKELKGFVAKVNRPLLFGAIMKVGERYYNAAILLSKDGEVVKEYDKVHLVPFGEFIPFRNLLPWLSDVLGLADFTAGKEYAVFSLPETVGKSKEAPLNFSVLICFEDTIARLARRFVQPGADFLINITNDAWFGDSKEPFMHLQSSVFRAVENRRYMVRAANTGVSCFIDKLGRIYNYLENNRKKTFVTAFSVDKVEFESGQTFYTKFGDIFTYLCFGCILWGIVTRKMKSRRE